MTSRDGEVSVMVAARRADHVTPGSVFGSLDHASAFFRGAPVGYAATPKAGSFDGVALTADKWAMAPLHLDGVTSTFFEDPSRFPPGTTVVDSAFLMEDLDSTWTPQPAMREPAGV